MTSAPSSAISPGLTRSPGSAAESTPDIDGNSSAAVSAGIDTGSITTLPLPCQPDGPSARDSPSSTSAPSSTRNVRAGELDSVVRRLGINHEGAERELLPAPAADLETGPGAHPWRPGHLAGHRPERHARTVRSPAKADAGILEHAIERLHPPLLQPQRTAQVPGKTQTISARGRKQRRDPARPDQREVGAPSFRKCWHRRGRPDLSSPWR